MDGICRKTATEIKLGIMCCNSKLDGIRSCMICPYGYGGDSCDGQPGTDAMAYILELEERCKLAPPVTIGTKLFCVAFDEDEERYFVSESEVAEIWYNTNGWFFVEKGHSGPAFRPKHIGMTVFLNREEAKKQCRIANERENNTKKGALADGSGTDLQPGSAGTGTF